MKHFYISTQLGTSGICKYANDFYNLVLKDKNYIFIDSNTDFDTIISQLSVNDKIHLEIGIFQKKEIQILLYLLQSNYKNITITLHDPPLIKFPFYAFKNQFLNKIAKFYDIYFNSGNAINKYLKKIKTIYVLSHKGVAIVQQKYKLQNVQYLPHIIDTNNIETSTSNNQNFVYLGFIGKNKGIEYSLKLHQNMLATHPHIKYYVVGTAMGTELAYFNYLKKTYQQNVYYLGYVSNDKLAAIFADATFAPLFFNSYKFYYPFSGSILYSLTKGKIVITNNTNTTGELIQNGKNGFIFTQNLAHDTQTLLKIFKNPNLLHNIKAEIPRFLNTHYSITAVNNYFIN